MDSGIFSFVLKGSSFSNRRSVNDDVVVALDVPKLDEFLFLSTFQFHQKPKAAHLF